MCYSKLQRWCEKVQPWAELPLRIVFGVVFIAHGGQKLFGWWGGPGVEKFAGFLGQLGFAPAGFWSWAVSLVEFGGGILVLIGLLTPFAAALIAINMLVAMLAVHRPNGFFLANGGVEFTLILFAVAVYFTLSGAGKWSVDGLWGKRKANTKSEPPSAAGM